MNLEEQITITKRKDKQLLVLLHLSQLLDYVTGLGGTIVPLILWLVNKDSVEGMDNHGKAILNFKISMLLYAFISIPLILVFGLGILLLFGIGILSFIYPIINAINASEGKEINYPFSIQFIS